MIRSIQTRGEVLSGAVALANITADTPVTLLGESVPGDQRKLLEAMGLAGAPSTVRVCNSGTPLIVEVDGTRVGLSAPVARQIMAVPLPPKR